MPVHQLIPCFTPGDAMGQAAVAWQRLLRQAGLAGELFAGEVAPGHGRVARSASELAPAPHDVVLYHHGIASALAPRFMHLPCRRVLVYHNVTPARWYQGTRLSEALVAGRAQLAALAPFVDAAIGVSAYNARELERAGFRRPAVVPLCVEPERFTAERADAATFARLRRRSGPRLLSVGRVVPHKRVEDLLSLLEALRRLRPGATLVLLGAMAPGQRAVRSLLRRARALGGVEVLGAVSHAALVAAYRAADLYVSMSEHEGFGVPLVEAMAADLPVLAFEAAAVPETLGGHGVGFDEKRYDVLAEVAAAVCDDSALRRAIVEGQRARVRDFSVERTREALVAALHGLVEPGAAPAVRPRPTRRRATRRRLRVAVVVQRYGEHVTGGAEAHARQVALRLAEHADVEVLTSCARDHLTWADELPAGVSVDGPVRVERFAGVGPRTMRAFNRLSDALLGRPQDLVAETRWVAEQGPLLPGLLEALSARRHAYDGFVFFTALYAPTVLGLPVVADRALLVPTAHDEPPLRLLVYADAFERARALLCNTPEEVDLVRRLFPRAARARVVGVGVEPVVGRAERFRARVGVVGPYLLSLGRVEAGKGVGELLEAYGHLRGALRGEAPSLLIAGEGPLRVAAPGVRLLGRLSEEDKWDALAGAVAVCVPSRYESLSLVTLEALASGTPVLGQAASPVVAGQLRRSRGGVAYDDDASFVEGYRRVCEGRSGFSERGRAFAATFRWPRIIDAYLQELEGLERRAGGASP